MRSDRAPWATGVVPRFPARRSGAGTYAPGRGLLPVRFPDSEGSRYRARRDLWQSCGSLCRPPTGRGYRVGRSAHRGRALSAPRAPRVRATRCISAIFSTRQTHRPPGRSPCGASSKHALKDEPREASAKLHAIGTTNHTIRRRLRVACVRRRPWSPHAACRETRSARVTIRPWGRATPGPGRTQRRRTESREIDEGSRVGGAQPRRRVARRRPPPSLRGAEHAPAALDIIAQELAPNTRDDSIQASSKLKALQTRQPIHAPKASS